MKFPSKALLTAACLTMMLSSCSDEPQGGPTEKDGSAYATITLSLPIGSRSDTTDWDDEGNSNSSDGYEIGNQFENAVGSVFVVLADKEGDSYKAVATANSDISLAQSGDRPTYILTFQSSELQTLVGRDPDTDPVYLFAFCNATHKMQETIKTSQSLDVPEGDVTVEGESIWTDNNFLMSNRQIVKVDKIIDLTGHTEPSNPFDLGTVPVQRAAVRFDFKQKKAADGSGEADNEYAIKNEITGTKMGVVVLDKMALLNQSKSYYLLSRTSTIATWESADVKPGLCVPETPSNWVVSTNKALKQLPDVNSGMTELIDKFSYTGRTPAVHYIDFESTDFEWTTITDIENNREDIHEGEDGNITWPNDKKEKTGYHIWRYTTENTIPGFESGSTTATQRRGFTTGIIFRGYIKAAEGLDLDSYLADKKVIYAYDGKILGDKDEVAEEANRAPGSALKKDYDEAFVASNLDSNGDLTKAYEGSDNKRYRFTIYRPKNIGTASAPDFKYVTYYVYLNRHWDNADNSIMRDMEFATVRNNVYKLSVDAINTFGHPGDPGDDPDPEDPDDPDESDKVYFKVSVKVHPWVVRVNSIIL